MFKGTFSRDLPCCNYLGMRKVDGHEHTTVFIKIVVNLWNISNFESLGVDIRFDNKVQILVQDRLGEGLDTILQFDEMVLETQKVIYGSITSNLTKIQL